MFVVISFKSTFSEPSKRMEHVKFVICAPHHTTPLTHITHAAFTHARARMHTEGARTSVAATCAVAHHMRRHSVHRVKCAPPIARPPAALPLIAVRPLRQQMPTAEPHVSHTITPTHAALTRALPLFTMSSSASFSIGSTQSACSASSRSAKTLLYGLVMTCSSPPGKTAAARRARAQGGSAQSNAHGRARAAEVGVAVAARRARTHAKPEHIRKLGLQCAQHVCPEARPGAAAQRVQQQEALDGVAVLHRGTHAVNNGIVVPRPILVVAVRPAPVTPS